MPTGQRNGRDLRGRQTLSIDAQRAAAREDHRSFDDVLETEATKSIIS
jgi:hypothetical protein